MFRVTQMLLFSSSEKIKVGGRAYSILCEFLFCFMQLKLINLLEIMWERFEVYFWGCVLAFRGLLCCDVLLKTSDELFSFNFVMPWLVQRLCTSKPLCSQNILLSGIPDLTLKYIFHLVVLAASGWPPYRCCLRCFWTAFLGAAFLLVPTFWPLHSSVPFWYGPSYPLLLADILPFLSLCFFSWEPRRSPTLPASLPSH